MEKYTPGKNFMVMTRQQVRNFDSWAINELQLPGVVLMENAGRSCAELIIRKLEGSNKHKVVIFCGTGNNGGDGYVIARHLLNTGFEVRVVLCGQKQKVKGDARINLDVLEKLGVKLEQLHPIEGENEFVGEISSGARILVDAVFGTGLTGTVKDEYQKVIEAINKQNIPILAVDIPSGLDCDTGQPLGSAIRATWTVTFTAVKKGFVSSIDAARYTGEVFIASIGVEPKSAKSG